MVTSVNEARMHQDMPIIEKQVQTEIRDYEKVRD
jgi:hypothetical protein